MGFKLHLVYEKELDLEKIMALKMLYMGDGIFDAEILKKAKYGIAPRNARTEAKNNSDFVTKSKSAEGAVLDACINIKKIL